MGEAALRMQEGTVMLRDGAAAITAPTCPSTLQRPPQAAGSLWELEDSGGSPGWDNLPGVSKSISNGTAKFITSTCHDLPGMNFY